MLLPPALIERIYEAALDHATAENMLEVLARVIANTQAVVTQYDGREQRPVGTAGVVGRFDPGVVRVYMEQYASNLGAEAVHAGNGRSVALDGPVPVGTLEQNGLYADALRPSGLAHGAGGALPVAEGRVLRIGLGQGRAALAERFDALAQLRRAELAALDRAATAALLVDHRGDLLLANHAARRLAAQGALLLKDGSPPGCADRAATATFRAAAMAAAAGQAPPPIRFRDALGAPLILIATPLGDGTALRLTEAGASGHAAATLIIHGTMNEAGPSAELLRNLFELTPTEARAASALAVGDSEREAAQRLGMGLASLRTHRKRIFAKIGITRRGELIRLCATLPR